MKRIILFTLTIFAHSLAFSQKDANPSDKPSEKISETITEEKAWKFGGGGGLYGSQIQLVNWSAGGQSSISGKVMGDIFANYRKGKHSWENNFRGEWGVIKNESSPITKNVDMFLLNSKYGYQIDKKGKLFLGTLLSFTSQFSPSFEEGSQTNYITNFLAPGRMILAVGLDWKLNKTFSLFISPAPSKFTFVTDNGVDETEFGLEAGTKVRVEFGAFIKAEFKEEIFKNVNLSTAISVYTNYLDDSKDAYYENDVFIKNKSNRANLDVDWTVGIDMTINKWLNVNIATHLIYDHDVIITRTDKDGNLRVGPTTQFSEAINVGLTYRFDPTKTKKAKAAAAAAAAEAVK